jgi:hypothetical protein
LIDRAIRARISRPADDPRIRLCQVNAIDEEALPASASCLQAELSKHFIAHFRIRSVPRFDGVVTTTCGSRWKREEKYAIMSIKLVI